MAGFFFKLQILQKYSNYSGEFALNF